MATLRYEMNYGDANAGGAPTFDYFVRQDTGAAVTPPAIVEAPWRHGAYYFDWDWATSVSQTISWKAKLNGIELSDVISSPALASSGASTVTAAPWSLAGYSTAKTILNRAAVQCNLTAVADPFGSTDPNFVQLIEALNTLGDDLNNAHDWTHFVRECVILTANNALSYALPADFHQMFDGSGWNRNTRLPMIGPITAQESQFVKSWFSGLIVNVAYRIQGNLITFPFAPPNGHTLAFEYLSTSWVQSAGSGTGPDASAVTLSTDVVLYDPEVMIAGVKLKWLEQHGFDTQKAEERYAAKLEHAIGKNHGGRTLSLGGAGLNADRLLNNNNVPVTGYGA